jgi:hypothetical protein
MENIGSEAGAQDDENADDEVESVAIQDVLRSTH